MSPAHYQTEGQSGVIMLLRIFRESHGQEIRMTLEEKEQGKEITLQQCTRTAMSMSDLQSLSQEIYSLLCRFIYSGNNTKGVGQRLQEAGQHLYDSLFSLSIKEKLALAGSRDLCLAIDDSLVGIPWEILYDGEEFFCLRFNMGRLVTTAQPVCQPKSRNPQGRNLQPKNKMLILADPKNDLPSSYQEGVLLCRELEKWGAPLEVSLETSRIDSRRVLRQISRFDILHYAGHAIYDHKNPGLSGWCLQNGLLTAQDVIRISGGNRSFPLLIFSNACRSGQTSAWPTMKAGEYGHDHHDQWANHAFDMVNAFLRCGVQHYIGTFQDIVDPTSFDLAISFYHFMMQSCSIGESLRQARLQIFNQYGHDNLIWASYMLYGDPTTCYLKRPQDEQGDNDHREPGDEQQEHPSFRPMGLIHHHIASQGAGEISEQGKSGTRAGTFPPREDSPPQNTVQSALHGAIKQSIDPGPGVSEKRRETWAMKTGAMKTWIWVRQMRSLLLIGCGLLFFTILMGTLARILSPALETQNASSDITSGSGISRESITREYDLAWEKEKWRIVEVIKEKLEQRYPFRKGDGQNSVANSGLKTAPFTICIVPATLSGRHNHNNREDGWLSSLSDYLIEELDLFWVQQHGFLVVERDRMDFVLRELELATSKVSEGKLQFALGKILGARGILFVRVFFESGQFFLFSFNRRAKVFVRYVDTETSAILAIAEESFQDRSDLKRVSQSLGEKILRSVHPSVHLSPGGEVSNEE